eukprot:TRINITY_DN3078_c1_g1_i1.p1 TRINITY_DN3078_c1_g1~~TRINITY_DN3078_c1_g1_i1.p1  ORF type:complete len:712 (+),score=172.05 TRINITY_DN3078_c1_g1_i1:1-2136(+)
MEAKWGGSLIVFVEGAKKVKNADMFGSSDPFCEVQFVCGGDIEYKARTNTIEDNLSPTWNQTFLKRLSGTGPITIKLTVYDEDDVGKDDFLGQYQLDFTPPSHSHDENKEAALCNKKGKPSKKNKKGTLFFSIHWIPDHHFPTQQQSPSAYSFEGGKEGKVALGPILLFRGTDNKTKEYKLSMLALYEGTGGETPLLTLDPRPHKDDVDVAPLLTYKQYTLWRYSFSMIRGKERVVVKYFFNDKNHEFEIPAISDNLRSLFVSCNGFHEEPATPPPRPKYHMWQQILNHHKQSELGRYHLIIQGGDQVYADPLWHQIELLKGHEPGSKSVLPIQPNLKFEEQVEDFYMNLYIESWGGPEISEAYASIPSVMMWDDHDIFDGWGSYEPEVMNSPVYKILGKAADRYFSAFQLGATPVELEHKGLPCSLKGNHKGKTQVYRIDRTAIVCLDLRSERSAHLVCSEETYAEFYNYLNDITDVDHVYLVLSIPIVYNDFDVLENAISATGLGKELEDDLKDHWRTKDHREERRVLLQKLLQAAERGKYRITILSGDVHIGCAGAIYDTERRKKSNASIIYSLISSAVVNVQPPEGVVHMLELTGGEIEDVFEDKEWHIKAGLLRFHHDPRKARYLPGRNFLELNSNQQRGVWCRWFCELQEEDPFELYISPYIQGRSFDYYLHLDDWRYVKELIGKKLLGFPTPSIYAGWKKKAHK